MKIGSAKIVYEYISMGITLSLPNLSGSETHKVNSEYVGPGAEPKLLNSIPISSEFPDEGDIQFYGDAVLDDLDGIFSFVLYYRNNDFTDSLYYLGLLLYAQLINNDPFFSKTGIVIYTDVTSFKIMEPLFNTFPRVIFAIVHWKPFMTSKNTVEDTILRCLRLQATEAFKNAWICIRDADTLFPKLISTINNAYIKGYTGIDSDGNKIINHIDFLSKKIGSWEKLFITHMNMGDKQIYYGVSSEYLTEWHTDILLNYSPKKRETQRRLTNYKKNTGVEFHFKSHLGVYAGFVNFRKDRPNDIWFLCYDYLTARYFLSDIKQISNEHIHFVNRGYQKTVQNKIGKDERCLLFAIMPKYLSSISFYHILYNDKDIYQETLDKLNIDKVVLLTINNLPFETILLQDKYVISIYNLTGDYSSAYYEKIFMKMVEDYNAFRDKLYAMSNENMSRHITAFISKENSTVRELNLPYEPLNGPVKLVPRTRKMGGKRKWTRRRVTRPTISL